MLLEAVPTLFSDGGAVVQGRARPSGRRNGDNRLISAYVEVLTPTYRAPTIKQHLAAIRMLFDWLVVG
jgi:hypothetical protein